MRKQGQEGIEIVDLVCTVPRNGCSRKLRKAAIEQSNNKKSARLSHAFS
jgi:hypothetical protein